MDVKDLTRSLYSEYLIACSSLKIESTLSFSYYLFCGLLFSVGGVFNKIWYLGSIFCIIMIIVCSIDYNAKLKHLRGLYNIDKGSRWLK